MRYPTGSIPFIAVLAAFAACSVEFYFEIVFG
jgi:hypothetical protein